MRRQRADQLLSHCGGKMLGDFKALHEVEAASKVDRPGKVCGAKLAGIDHKALPIDVVSIDPDNRCADRGPSAQPRSVRSRNPQRSRPE